MTKIKRDKGKIIDEVVTALIGHSKIIHEVKSGNYFRHDGYCWRKEDVSYVQKLILNYSNNLSKSLRDEILNVFTLRVVSGLLDSESSVENQCNLLNGIFDIKQKKLNPHSSKYPFLSVMPVKYIPGSDCQEWLKFLSEVLSGSEALINQIQDMFGYCLLRGNRLHVCFILKGEGNNGKSTLLDILRTLLGEDNTSSLSLKDFENRFRLANFRGKLANISEETPTDTAFSSDIFKNLVSGGRILTEQKFKPAFEFNNQAKIIFATNSPPYFKDHTHGLYRRLIIIPFNYQIPESKIDRFLKERLIKELSGIFNWSIVGASRVLANNRISTSKESQEALNLFKSDTDSVLRFVNEKCKFGNDACCQVDIIFEQYVIYCDSGKYKPCSKNQFAERLKTHFPSIQHRRSTTENNGRRPYIWEGIAMESIS